MSTAIPLIPRVKSFDAEGNLAAFIARARHELTGFGADLDFDADSWDVTNYYSKKGHRNAKQGTITIHFCQRLKEGGTPFCRQISEFAKAYIRTQLANLTSSSFTYAVTAFRALDTSIQEHGLASLVFCDAVVFNRAAELLRLHTPAGYNQSAGDILGVIARFMDENGFVYAPLHGWRYPRGRKATSGRIGPEFERRRKEKTPSPEALDGLAQAFHLAIEPRDVLITSITAIMCSAPERINEVMLLPVDCEVEQTGKDGRKYLGLRWAGSKGAADHIKWLLPGMADVVREALARIRRLSEPAREMARWYERYPTKLYLPPELEHLRGKGILTLEEVWEIANLSPNKRIVRGWLRRGNIPFAYMPAMHPIQGEIQIQAARFADIERFLVGMLPPGFPMYDEGRGLRYSEALLAISEGLFGNRGNGAGNRCMFEVVKYHHIGCALGQNKHSGSTTIFERVGIDPEGKLTMRSHQFRHWLNTLAQGANLSQVDIAKWSGRANIDQNASYDHVTSDAIVAKIREAVGDHAKAIGPLAEIPKNLPVTRAEFASMAVPTAHVTLYGFCIHDFTSTPCEMFRKCMDCREHVCVKGVPGKTERVRQALEAARDNLAKARKAVAEQVYGAEDWVIMHVASIERMEQLLSILDDPSVTDGAVIQLSSSNTYSVSDGALLDRLNAGSGRQVTLAGTTTKKALS